jgi:hypothetical protein
MPRPMFEGVRFWVYDNVPMRERWLEDIQVLVFGIRLARQPLLTYSRTMAES